MANRVQIVITVDETKAEAGVKKVRSALKDMGATATTVTDQGTRGFQKFESQGLLKAVLGANLLERAITSAAGRMKDMIVQSTLLTARSDVLDTVMAQLAGTTGQNIRVLRAQQREMEALGIDTIGAQEAIVKFTTAELSSADAVSQRRADLGRRHLGDDGAVDTLHPGAGSRATEARRDCRAAKGRL